MSTRSPRPRLRGRQACSRSETCAVFKQQVLAWLVAAQDASARSPVPERTRDAGRGAAVCDRDVIGWAPCRHVPASETDRSCGRRPRNFGARIGIAAASATRKHTASSLVSRSTAPTRSSALPLFLASLPSTMVRCARRLPRTTHD